MQDDTRWGELKAGQVMAEAKPVFAKIENNQDGDKKGSTKECENKKTLRQGLVEA